MLPLLPQLLLALLVLLSLLHGKVQSIESQFLALNYKGLYNENLRVHILRR